MGSPTKAGDIDPTLRPWVDLPISLGRLRTLRGFQVLSFIVAAGWMLAATHPACLPVLAFVAAPLRLGLAPLEAAQCYAAVPRRTGLAAL